MRFLLALNLGAIMRRLLLLIPLLVVSDHLSASQVKLLVLGDSLSAAYGLKQEQGWVSLLQNAWESQEIDVVNAAISGETTDGGLARLPRLLEQHSPTHILVELGGNDGLQGHNVNKLRSNLELIIQKAQQAGVKVILQEIQIPTNYGRRYNQLFTDSYQLVADKTNVPLIPFFLQDIALKEELMQRDGIHPNAEAQPMIADFMGDALLPLLQVRH